MARARSLKPDVVPLGAKRCTNCKRVKPAESFRAMTVAAFRDGRHCWCRPCERIAQAERRETEEYRAWAAEHYARPDVKARRAEADRRRNRTPKRVAQLRAYRKTPLGRLLHSRRQMVRRQAERLAAGRLDAHAKGEALLAQYDAEIARLRAALDGEGRRGPRPRRAFGSTEKDVTR